MFFVSIASAGPQEAQLAALADLRDLPIGEARSTRYLWQPGGFTEEQVAVLNVQVNRNSRETRKLTPVRQVGKELLAVVLDDYRWPPSLWEKLIETEPYFTIHAEEIVEVIETIQIVKDWPGGRWSDGKIYPAGSFTYYAKEEIRKPGVKKLIHSPDPYLDQTVSAELQARSGSRIPLVRADWWLVQVCRQVSIRNTETGIGYYDWLGIKNRNDFLNLIKFKQQDSEAVGRRYRAILDKSGVAQHGRQVALFDSITGLVAMTLDSKEWSQKNLQTELAQPGLYQHDAEEWFVQGGHGLWYMGLFAADGSLQATAPDYIGPDDSKLRSGRDGRIHVGLSCIRCHIEDGLRPIDCWARRTFRKPFNVKGFDRPAIKEFEELYLSDIESRLVEGRKKYALALVFLNGEKWTASEDAGALSRYYDRYVEDRIGVDRLSVERGIKVEVLLAKLEKATDVVGGLPISLAPLVKKGGTVRREIVEDFWPILQIRVR